jgi:hypothetical protein
MERQAKEKVEESPGGAEGDEDDDDDDDFFGSQEDEGDFGALGQHDDLAKDHELKTIGYVESYDETKETLLQDGFEAGYRETYEAALRVGRLFGKLSADTQLLPGKTAEFESSSSSSHKGSETTSRRLHDFLTEFQNRPKKSEAKNNTKESIELLEQELFGSKEG